MIIVKAYCIYPPHAYGLQKSAYEQRQWHMCYGNRIVDMKMLLNAEWENELRKHINVHTILCHYITYIH